METRHYRAAGGVVLDGGGRVLMIERDVQRDGRTVHEIRLPKGKLDACETDAQAAVRETGEETGYWHLRIIGDLGEHHSAYQHKGRHVERDERYFLMHLSSEQYDGQQMDPSSEEAKFSPRWAADLDEAERLLTFEGEKEFIRRARRALDATR